MPQPARPILWDIYEEHLDEAAFLFGQWERAMNAANYSLDEVIDGPEERLRAHLDGLVVGGRPVAERLLLPALADDDSGKVWAAAWALLHAEDADWLDLVVDAMKQAEAKEARAAIARAFELSERGDLKPRLLPQMPASAPEVQAVIVDIVSRRSAASEPGKAPVSDLALGDLLQTRHPELLAAALRALRRAPDPAYARLVESALGSPYVAIRDAALETGLILGMRSAWATCNKLVARNAMGARLPLAILALGGEPVDVKTVIKKLEVATMRRDALWALGFAGTVAAAEAVVGLLGDEELAKVAGESLSTIVGARISGALAEKGTTENAAPVEMSEDDDTPLPVVKPEDALPIPSATRVRAWWEKARSTFQPDLRYLHGKPVTGEVLRQAVALGSTWRRRAWSLEIAMRGGPDVDVGAWGRNQAAAHGGNREWGRGELPLPPLPRI